MTTPRNLSADDAPRFRGGADRNAPEPKVRTGRRAELVLLVAAVLIVTAAEAIVEATRNGKISSHVLIYGGVALAVALITHLVVVKTARFADPVLLPCVVLLNGLGLVMIHRLDLGLQQQAEEVGGKFDGNSAPTQMVWTAIGVAVFIA